MILNKSPLRKFQKIIDILLGFRNIRLIITKPMYIYGLRLKNSKKFVYIGKTNNPKIRLRHHIYYAKKGTHKNKKLGSWIKRNEQKMVMEIILKTNDIEVDKFEKKTIKHFISKRHPLLNIRV